MDVKPDLPSMWERTGEEMYYVEEGEVVAVFLRAETEDKVIVTEIPHSQRDSKYPHYEVELRINDHEGAEATIQRWNTKDVTGVVSKVEKYTKLMDNIRQTIELFNAPL